MRTILACLLGNFNLFSRSFFSPDRLVKLPEGVTVWYHLPKGVELALDGLEVWLDIREVNVDSGTQENEEPEEAKQRGQHGSAVHPPQEQVILRKDALVLLKERLDALMVTGLEWF